MTRDAQTVTDAIPLEVTGSLKHPETNQQFFIERGRMFAAVTDSGERAYLALDALPKELLGADSPYTFHAKIVNQEPVIPVTATLTENGGCNISLKPEAYTRERLINQNYHILAKAAVGPVEYVLAENPASRFFVTWERTPGNDKPGEPNFYWGHYKQDRANILRDFSARVAEKCAVLDALRDSRESKRRPSILQMLRRPPVSGRDTSGTARQTQVSL